MTLTAYSDALCTIIEPNVAPTSALFSALNTDYMLTSPHNAELMSYCRRICEAHGSEHNISEIFEYLNSFETGTKPVLYHCGCTDSIHNSQQYGNEGASARCCEHTKKGNRKRILSS